MNFYTNPHSNFTFKTKLRQKMKNEPRSPHSIRGLSKKQVMDLSMDNVVPYIRKDILLVLAGRFVGYGH